MSARLRLAAATALSGWCVLPAPLFAQAAPAPFMTATRYDIARRVTGVIGADPDGSGPRGFPATRNSYDVRGDLVRVERGELSGWQGDAVAPADWTGFAVLEATDTAYDPQGRKLSERKGVPGDQPVLTQFAWDGLGRPTCTAIRMGNFAAAPADACQQTPSAVEPDRITRNLYGPTGRLLQVRRGVGTALEQAEATYGYTPNGRRSDVIDAAGNHAAMAYDGLDRLVRWSLPSPTKPTGFDFATPASAVATAGAVSAGDYEQYGWDANGNRTSLRKRDGQVIGYGYDALNRLSSKSPPLASAAVTYKYDFAGRPADVVFTATGKGLFYVYDKAGRPVAWVTNVDGPNMAFGYYHDADGNRTQMLYAGGSGTFDYGYDGLNRMTSISALEARGVSSLLATFAYDGLGRRSFLSHGGGASTSYAYDAVSRPVSVTHDMAGAAGDVTYGMAWNPAGQIVTRTASNGAYGLASYDQGTQSYTTDGLNRYTQIARTSSATTVQAYDGNGNLAANGARSYGYDAENRLVSVSGPLSGTLSYDPLGRLSLMVAGNGTTARFLYDGDALVAEYDGAGNIVGRYVHGPGVDEPLVWYQGSGSPAATRKYLFADQQGSLTGAADNVGNFVAGRAYDEWGVTTLWPSSRFGYTGQLWLKELELYHYKARAYEPKLGRFLQTDPVGYDDQVNLYAYVGNDPVNGTDPSGMDTCPGGNPEHICVTAPPPIKSVVFVNEGDLQSNEERRQVPRNDENEIVVTARGRYEPVASAAACFIMRQAKATT